MTVEKKKACLRPYHFKNAFQHLSRALQHFANKGSQYITKVRLDEGELEARDLEEAIKFIEDLAQECQSLAY